PNTDYYVYTLPIGNDGTEAAYDSAYVKTAAAGGSGEALATIQLFDITSSSVRMIVTPNSETAEFHDGLITKEYFEEIGQEAALEYFKNDGQPLFDTDEWVWLDLGSDTTYLAIAICKNGVGEWGTPTIEEFTTLVLSVGNNQNNALIIYPNPNHGQFEVKGSNITGSVVSVYDISGKQVFSQTLDSNHMSVNISHCESGTYIVEILNQGVRTTTKLLIQ
ncbi:MAG: T9SS type A sorting domain-containing protein, partial [Salinivirgaceae bacterium]|nr:T9SS type A sorting domain-containing protein [Salinivirgaceae bacterium]